MSPVFWFGAASTYSPCGGMLTRSPHMGQRVDRLRGTQSVPGGLAVLIDSPWYRNWHRTLRDKRISGGTREVRGLGISPETAAGVSVPTRLRVGRAEVDGWVHEMPTIMRSADCVRDRVHAMA